MVVSSIIQKLTKLFTIPTFKKHILIHPSLKEDYYLKGHQDDSLSVLNHHLLGLQTIPSSSITNAYQSST